MQWNEFRSHIRHLSTHDQERIRKAFEMGKKAHGDQKRKSGEPYFSHPVAVAHALADMSADADTIVAALLHDTIEDTSLTLDTIQEVFGPDVSAMINGVTKLSSTDLPASPTLDEQIETIRKIFTLMQEDIRIMVVKLADRLHNMQTVSFLSDERKKAMATETMEVYVKIADRLCMQDIRDDLESLSLEALDPHHFLALKNLRQENEAKGLLVMRTMQKAIEKTPAPPSVECRFESKSWDSLHHQLEMNGNVATGFTPFTIVFIVEQVEQCYQMMGTLHQLWRRETLSFQDYINAPMVNGYQGLHTTVILEDGTRVRCKIRTQEMHEYARKGVSVRCFDSKARGILEYLQWAERISPLAEGTTHRSQDFWQSLQSDILGTSITIHGPDGNAIQIPSDATALDGAFYCLGTTALRVSGTKINGMDVTPYTTLKHGDSLDFVLEKRKGVDRSWLANVHTGLAAAAIRKALAEQPTMKKRETGTLLLESVLQEERKGFLEEFDPSLLTERLAVLGFNSLDEALIAIADGRTDAREVYHALFSLNASGMEEKRRRLILRIRQPSAVTDDLDALLHVFHEKPALFRSIHVENIEGQRGWIITVRATLSSTERTDLLRRLETVGIQSVETERDNALPQQMLLGTVIVLWALNPVWAKWFLTQGVTPLNLITIRLITFCIFTSAFFLIWRKMTTTSSIIRIPSALSIAIRPTLANLALLTSTYLALQWMIPSLHLTILRFNALLLPLITVLFGAGQTKKNGRVSLLSLSLLGFCIVMSVLIFGQEMLPGLALSTLTLVFYSGYSIITEQALQQNRINVRYPYFLFTMGLILGVIGLCLIPFQNRADLLGPHTPHMIAYVILCVCIPHTCYSTVLKRAKFSRITDLLLLEIPLAFLFEMMILNLQLPAPAYAMMVSILFLILLARGGASRLLPERSQRFTD